MVLVDEDIDAVLDDFDDSDSYTVSDYIDTESEPEVEPDSQSDAEKETDADIIQYKWLSQSTVDSEPFPFMEDSAVKLVLQDYQSPLEIFHAFFDDE